MRELHFLERGVERMERPELEFALQLYQDRPLLTAVLSGIQVPEGTLRIALGLAEGGQGPWIVVTRAGDLVTCLAKGMNPTGLHVVSMGKVAQLVALEMRQRERLAWVAEAAPEKREKNLIKELFLGGRGFSREAFRVQAAFYALHYSAVSGALPGSYEYLCDVRKNAALLTRGKGAEHVLRSYEKIAWGCSAALPLLALDGREQGWMGPHPQDHASLATSDRLMGPTLRAAWATGRVGKGVLPAMKTGLRDAPVYVYYVASVLALLVTGLRYRSTRAEIRKVLTAQTPAPIWDSWSREVHEMYRVRYGELLDEPEVFRECFDEAAQKFAFSLVQKAGGALLEQYPDAPSIPLDLARPVATMQPGNICVEENLFDLLLAATPWLAQCEAEDLFVPEAFLRAARLQGNPDTARELLLRWVDKKQEPVRAAKKPGRNERCTCGSGKKFKACCARLAA